MINLVSKPPVIWSFGVALAPLSPAEVVVAHLRFCQIWHWHQLLLTVSKRAICAWQHRFFDSVLKFEQSPSHREETLF